MKPYEIVIHPFTVWWAPVGESFPAIDADPGGNWTKIGTSGNRNYSDDGVTVAHSQTIQRHRAAGSTGGRKASRTEEDFLVRFTLWDLLLEQYKLALNQNSVATTAAGSGTAGFKELPIYRGLDVATLALLVRGVSPEGVAADDTPWNAQFQLPVCYQSGSPEPVFAKSGPAGLALEFSALEDEDAASADERFGKLIVQHQDAL